ncbi:MAG: DUF1926 domain-containing protein [Gaiellales bacterium]|nr:DUF1926 domain-containing protein [Gaiellales bacterium]
MNCIYLALGIHNHQPVGNFAWVFEKNYRTAYLPFLNVMEDSTALPFSLHTSGPLLQWLLECHPEYVSRVRNLVEAGRVEIKGGCLYEAILPLLPREDRSEQLRRFSALLEDTFGARPEGAWLPERVWEPDLPRDLREAGLEYTVVDDSHFASAGISGRLSRGYFLTEDQGYRFDLFPINKELRYLIPFHEPIEIVGFMREALEADKAARAEGDLAADAPPPLLVYDDDGEKFGAWPETSHHVYGKKWLQRFLREIEGAAREGWLRVTTPGAYRRESAPLGRVYLPPGSYSEMLEWSGGFFRNFLSRYEEANRMHKRMLEVSARTRVGAGAGPEAAAAREALLRAQCNDAYWHGIFGGLYLPHLRQATYANLLEAESLLPPGPAASFHDIDMDGHAEVRLRSRTLLAFVSPARGGSLVSLDHLPSRASLLDTLHRLHETEHDRLRDTAATPAKGAPGATSIHRRAHTAEPGLERHLHEDRALRDSLRDHFYLPGFGWEDLLSGSAQELGETAPPTYVAELPDETRCVVALQAGTTVAGYPVAMEKRLELADNPSRLLVNYHLAVGPPPGDRPSHHLPRRSSAVPAHCPSFACFAPELNLNLLGAWSDDYYVLLNGERPPSPRLADGGTHHDTTEITLVDPNRQLRVSLAWPKTAPATLHRYGVITVSSSERGYEMIAQATCLTPTWNLVLEAGTELALELVLTITRQAE